MKSENIYSAPVENCRPMTTSGPNAECQNDVKSETNGNYVPMPMQPCSHSSDRNTTQTNAYVQTENHNEKHSSVPQIIIIIIIKTVLITVTITVLSRHKFATTGAVKEFTTASLSCCRQLPFIMPYYSTLHV